MKQTTGRFFGKSVQQVGLGWIGILAVCLAASTSEALTTNTWTATSGTNFWNDGANWSGGSTPSSANTTALQFTNLTGGTSFGASNDLANPFILNQLILSNAVSTTNVSLMGDPLSFQGTTPSLVQKGAGPGVINNNMTLGADTTVSGTGAGQLNLNGVISGSSALIKTASCTVVLSGDNTFSGGVDVQKGTLIAGHNNALGSGTLTLRDGTTFYGDPAIPNGVYTNNIVLIADSGTIAIGTVGSATITPTYSGNITASGPSSGQLSLFTPKYATTIFSNGTMNLGGRILAFGTGGNGGAVGFQFVNETITNVSSVSASAQGDNLNFMGTTRVDIDGDVTVNNDWTSFLLQDSASVSCSNFNGRVVNGTLNLVGGTLTVNKIKGQSAGFVLKGVTLRAGPLATSWFGPSGNNYCAPYLYNAGVTFDSNGRDVAIGQGIYRNGNGGPMTKTGAGTLTLGYIQLTNNAAVSVTGGTLAADFSQWAWVSNAAPVNALAANSGSPNVTLSNGAGLTIKGRPNAAAASGGTWTTASVSLLGAGTCALDGTGGTTTAGLTVGQPLAITYEGGAVTNTYIVYIDSATRLITGSKYIASNITSVAFDAYNPVSTQNVNTLTVNTGSGASVVTVDNNSGSGTVLVVTNLTGAGNLAKAGNGTLVLTTNNSFSGSMTVSNGTVVLTGTAASFSNCPSINLAGASAVLDVTALAGGFPLQTNQALYGNGSISGTVLVASNAVISPAGDGVIGTLTINGDCTLSSNTVMHLDYSATQSDALVVNGTLTLPRVLTLTNLSSTAKFNQITIMRCNALSMTSTNFSNWNITGISGSLYVEFNSATKEIVLVRRPTGGIIMIQ